jgi:hypothetical protein
VVLADGSIRNVNYTSYSDLYYALRGGGNNFGIVTRFDFETFEQGSMWGGMVVYPVSANRSLSTAFENFANKASEDPDAGLISAFGLSPQGQYLAANDYSYAKPIPDPPIFKEFRSIESIGSTLKVRNLTDLALELNSVNPSGFRSAN